MNYVSPTTSLKRCIMCRLLRSSSSAACLAYFAAYNVYYVDAAAKSLWTRAQEEDWNDDAHGDLDHDAYVAARGKGKETNDHE